MSAGRSQRFSFSYDTLRRPVDRTVSVSGGSEKLLGRIVYGDLLATPETTNHVGRVYRVYDGAGVATTVAFDFKGHATSEQRQLVSDKTTQPDWSALLGESTIAAMATAAASLLDSETFEASSERDALGRVLVAISPDDSEVLYSYDEGGGLQKVELKHRGSSTAQTVIGDITYNARGQREQVIYGSTSSPTMTTSYGYDPQTYRLAHLSTIRESDDASLQGLHYHYDPVGNITDIRDTAQQTVYFQNSVVEAANSYEYDAVYRLIEATGREHASQGTTQRTHEQLAVGPQPMTSDPSAMRRYTQKYTYDSVGNILVMQHIPASGSGWTRYYQYDDEGNRLEATSAPGDDPEGPYTHTYSYDAHGSMTAMPHLSSMIWNHEDELQEVTVGTETVYFQYAGGMRSRKYTEKAGAITEERIYLGAFEIYRKRLSGSLTLERESLHVSDGTGRICIVETKTVGSGSPVVVWRYQLGNHLGSAATEVDESGEVISYEEYHPYGTSAYRAVDSSVDVSAKRYRYTGMERDEETGLAYHSARYYVPWLGRWTAGDPIGLAGGGNLYLYAAANPLVLADQQGLSPTYTRTETTVQVDEGGKSGTVGFGVERRPDPADNVRHGGTFEVGESTPSQNAGRSSEVTSDSHAVAPAPPSIGAGVLGFHPPGVSVPPGIFFGLGSPAGNSAPPAKAPFKALGPFTTEEEGIDAMLNHIYWLTYETRWEWSSWLFEWNGGFYYLRPITAHDRLSAPGLPSSPILSKIGPNLKYGAHSHLIEKGLAYNLVSPGDETVGLQTQRDRRLQLKALMIVMVDPSPPRSNLRPGFGQRFSPEVGLLWYMGKPSVPPPPKLSHRGGFVVARPTIETGVTRTNWTPDEDSHARHKEEAAMALLRWANDNPGLAWGLGIWNAPLLP